MNALSVREPWAAFMFLDTPKRKGVENRTWFYPYKDSELCICASKKVVDGWDQRAWCYKRQELIEEQGVSPDVLPINFADLIMPGYARGVVTVKGCDSEMTGDYWEEPNQYHIRLANARKFMYPFRQNGRLGVFRVNDTAIANARGLDGYRVAEIVPEQMELGL